MSESWITGTPEHDEQMRNARQLSSAFVIIQEKIGSKAERLALLQHRRDNPPVKVPDQFLPARYPMHYYCKSCGHGAAEMNEGHIFAPPSLCPECAALKELGWLE